MRFRNCPHRREGTRLLALPYRRMLALWHLGALGALQSSCPCKASPPLHGHHRAPCLAFCRCIVPDKTCVPPRVCSADCYVPLFTPGLAAAPSGAASLRAGMDGTYGSIPQKFHPVLRAQTHQMARA